MKKCTAVVGCGLWGRNIVRNFYNLGALHSVCDLDVENLKMIQELYPDVNTTSDFNSLLSNPEVVAMCIVTPSHTHFNLVKKAILAGKHVYVEKPISTSSSEAKELKELAEQMGVKLLVGHLLLYHPAVNRLKMLIAEGVLGEIKYAQSDRLNINYFKNDRSVMWDLAPHDVSMIAHVTGKAPLKVLSATGVASEFENICDITHLTIEFEDGVVGQVSDSWIHPQKRVSLLVRGTKATAILDDTIQEGKLKVYDNKKGSQNEIEVFDYLEIEPLKLECQHFLNCIKNDKVPRSDGENGYMIVKILEQAEAMMLGADKLALDKHEFKLSRSK
ncbi:MAG: Gfo/Idh/MocA family oxidoreductase [Candidatus Gastranaerophilales bacterium]|nr:Gfo/Idh/MocA family oxidoreductase [Candidatus Gastranaerophilales bacterium]